MQKLINKNMKRLSVILVAGLVSACGTTSSPQQLAEARAVHAFDENRAPFGQRIARAEAGFTPRVYGLNPYFGR